MVSTATKEPRGSSRIISQAMPCLAAPGRLNSRKQAPAAPALNPLKASTYHQQTPCWPAVSFSKARGHSKIKKTAEANSTAPAAKKLPRLMLSRRKRFSFIGQFLRYFLK